MLGLGYGIFWNGLDKNTAILPLHQGFWLFEPDFRIPGWAIPPGHICAAMDLVSDIRSALFFPQF
jgi:hypothetical protein